MSAACTRSLITTACDDQQRQRPARRASTIQETSPIDPSGPGSSTIKRLDPTCFDGGPQMRSDPQGRRSPTPTAKPMSRAPFTLGASVTCTLNLVRRGLRFLAAGPGDGDRTVTVGTEQPLDDAAAGRIAPRSTRAPRREITHRWQSPRTLAAYCTTVAQRSSVPTSVPRRQAPARSPLRQRTPELAGAGAYRLRSSGS